MKTTSNWKCCRARLRSFILFRSEKWVVCAAIRLCPTSNAHSSCFVSLMWFGNRSILFLFNVGLPPYNFLGASEATRQNKAKKMSPPRTVYNCSKPSPSRRAHILWGMLGRLSHWSIDKISAISPTTFQVYFREWKFMNFAYDFAEICS